MKRARLIAILFIVAIVTILMLGRFIPTEVAADPVIVGPPTIYEHVAGINASIQFFKYVTGILAAMFTFILGLLGYIWRITIANVKSSIHHVEANLQKDIDEHTKDIKGIKQDYMRTETHDRICKPGGQTV